MAQFMTEPGIGQTGCCGITEVIVKNAGERFRQDVQGKQRGTQGAEAFLPFLAVGRGVPSQSLMNAQVGHFMNIGKEKKKWMAVGVDRDAGRMTWATGEVAQFADAAVSKHELKRRFLPELVGVGYGTGRYVPLKNREEIGLHGRQDG